MMNLKKTLLITASTLAITTYSMAADVASEKLPVASDLKIKLSAYADFEAGFNKQSKVAKDEKNISGHRKSFAFFNRTALMAEISNKAEDTTYGAKIALVPTAKRKGGPSYDGSHIYVETNYGRVEMGSPFSAASMMAIDSGEISVGAGTGWAKFAKKDIAHITQGAKVAPTFATSVDFFLDDKLTTELDNRAYTSEPPRSVSYYTPKFTPTESTKIQVGASFTPDSSNTGADAITKISSGVATYKIEDAAGIDKIEIDSTVKNAITGGLVLEQNLSDGVDLKVALTGEVGKSAGYVRQYNTADKAADPKKYTTLAKLKNLKTYNIGAALNVGNFSYAGSYGSKGKSLTSADFHKTGRSTAYYTGAVAYKQGPFATSLSYFKSVEYKNNTDAISLGTDYQLAPGFKPYAQITRYSVKGKSVYDITKEKRKSRGVAVIIGAKVSI